MRFVYLSGTYFVYLSFLKSIPMEYTLKLEHFTYNWHPPSPVDSLENVKRVKIQQNMQSIKC